MKFAAENPAVQEILSQLSPDAHARINCARVYSSPMTPKQRQEGMERLIRAQDAI